MEAHLGEEMSVLSVLCTYLERRVGGGGRLCIGLLGPRKQMVASAVSDCRCDRLLKGIGRCWMITLPL